MINNKVTLNFGPLCVLGENRVIYSSPELPNQGGRTYVSGNTTTTMLICNQIIRQFGGNIVAK